MIKRFQSFVTSAVLRVESKALNPQHVIHECNPLPNHRDSTPAFVEQLHINKLLDKIIRLSLAL